MPFSCGLIRKTFEIEASIKLKYRCGLLMQTLCVGEQFDIGSDHDAV